MDFSKLGKKAGEGMSPEAKRAKMEVIMELMEMAKEMMGENVKTGMDEMKKVSIAAPDQESLEEGLDLAHKLVSDDMEGEATEEVMEDKEKPTLDEIVEEVSESSEPMVAAEEMKASDEDEDEDESPFGKPKQVKQKRKMFNMFDDKE